MILAVAVPEKRELVICAANSVREHKEFLRQIESNNPELIQDTDFSRFLMETELASFKFEPTILEFPDVESLNGFVAENSIETTNFSNAHGRQRRMLELEDFNADTGGRTLAEIHGLVDNDPWDRRTDEEKAEAEKKKKEMSDKAKAGDITGDSWGGGAGRSMTSEKKAAPEVIPVGTLPQGKYFVVTVAGALGNSPEELYRDVNHKAAPLFQKSLIEGDVHFYVFADEATAEIVAEEMRSILAHVGTARVDAINELGQPVGVGSEVVVNDDGSVSLSKPVVDATPDKNDPNATGGATGGSDPAEDKKGGLQIRDMKITINEDGSIEIGDILADKDLFSPDLYHLTLMDDAGQPSKNMDDYNAILKRSGLIGSGRYMDLEHEKQEEGGIIIQLGGAATLRAQAALNESGREYTLVARITEKEGYGDENVYKIANDQLVGTYFRADALDRSVAQVNTLIAETLGARAPYRARDLEAGGSWHAYIRRADAEKTVELLIEAGAKAELNEVDNLGVRIIEEGTEDAIVLDRDAKFVEPPAPWNDRREEFYALDEEGQKKAFQKLLPFLLYSLRDYGHPHRVIAHITPKTYFNEHDRLWDGELPLDDVLPDNFVKFGDKVGVYQIKSLDLNTTDFILGNKAKMKESLMLRAHLNSLGNDAQ